MNGLRYIRKAFGMTLSVLGKRMWITRQTISQWEQGTYAIPDARLKELSQIFGIPEFYFSEIGKEEIAELDALINAQRAETEDQYWFTQYDNAIKEERNVISKIDSHLKGKNRKFDSFQDMMDFIENETMCLDKFVTIASNDDLKSTLYDVLDKLCNSVLECDES